MSNKELVDKIVMFRTELERQNAGMGIMSLFDTICSYYGEQHRTIKSHLTTIESQKEEIDKKDIVIGRLYLALDLIGESTIDEISAEYARKSIKISKDFLSDSQSDVERLTNG